jgi:hypothetical protein
MMEDLSKRFSPAECLEESAIRVAHHERFPCHRVGFHETCYLNILWQRG